MPQGSPAPPDDDAVCHRLIALWSAHGPHELTDWQLRDVANRGPEVGVPYEIASAADAELERRADERESELQDRADAGDWE